MHRIAPFSTRVGYQLAGRSPGQPTLARRVTEPGILLGVFQRGPKHQSQRRLRALGATAEADNLQPLDVVALQRTGHLIEEVGQVGREVMR